MNDMTTGDTDAFSADINAVMRRSALRATVRATWACADSVHPPGRINWSTGGVIRSISSIDFSRRSTSEKLTGVSAFSPGVANAGVINFGNTWELTDEQVEKVINIDLIGTWRTNKYAVQYMLKQGFGRIINIASTSGLYGTPKLATYCMAKWGVLGLTKTLAKEVGSKGIIVNALCPTKVKTPMCETMEYVQFINELTGKNFKDYKEMYAGGPFLDVEDISDMVYWMGTSRAAGKFNGRDVALDLGTLQA